MDEDFSEVEVYSSEVPIIRRFNYDIVYINSIQHSYFKAQKVWITYLTGSLFKNKTQTNHKCPYNATPYQMHILTL